MLARRWILGVGLGCSVGWAAPSCAGGGDGSGTAGASPTSSVDTGGTSSGGTSSGGSTASGGQGTGGEVAGGGSGGASACVPYGDDCTECEYVECPDEYCGCVTSEDCAAVVLCLMACPSDNTECIQGCWTANPDGISDAALMQQCAATTCAADCGSYLALSDCEVCLFQNCESQMNSCMADADCSLLLQCVGLCETEPCQDDCVTDHPTGALLGTAVLSCGDASCSDECAVSG